MTEPDPRARDRLDRGEILIDTESVPGSHLPRVLVRAVFEAPPERVWAVIDPVRDYESTMANVKRSEELLRERQDDQTERVRARITVGMPFPLRDLTSVTDAIHTVVPGESYERAWTLVEGDYRENSGAWRLVPFDGDPTRTLVSYRLHAVPNIRIPAALHGIAQKKVIPRLINSLRGKIR
jgi:ribosome-associated toxin RatA of RatAB toxin-antitoxin module